MLPIISRSNQAIKFGQVIECSMKNVFLEKSFTKCGGETSPRSFSKKSKLTKTLNQQSEILIGFFLTISKLRTTKIY